MTRSHLLDSFDPFATHPFTNNSGLKPLPPSPSLSPVLMPSDLPTSSSSAPNLHTSQPVPLPSSPQATTPPIFVPYRRDTSSPELVLRKKPATSPMHKMIAIPRGSDILIECTAYPCFLTHYTHAEIILLHSFYVDPMKTGVPIYPWCKLFQEETFRNPVSFFFWWQWYTSECLYILNDHRIDRDAACSREHLKKT